MSSVVFLGPTLPLEEARKRLDATYLPPVRQGDVLRVIRRRPRAIGIVDGYFQGVPAVWHKEILWALSQGIHVFGGASMGALRAAELAPFGMVGVGEIFAAYCGGELTDDDEVAIVHGPAEIGYRARTEALVDIRATLSQAAVQGIIRPDTSDRLIRLAKQQHYSERGYNALWRIAAEVGVDPTELSALRDWLPQGRIDLKRRDAERLLHAMADHLANDPGPFQAAFRFEHTVAWEALLREIEPTDPASAPDRATRRDRLILDRLRLSGDYPGLAGQALMRLLAEREGRGGVLDTADTRRAAVDHELRRRHGLYTAAQWRAWLSRQGLDEAAWRALVRREVALDRLLEVAQPALNDYILDELRRAGDYARRAAEADRRLDSSPHGSPAPTVPEIALLAWFCRQQGLDDLPEDAEALARRLGFDTLAAFYRALRHEYAYWQSSRKE